MLRLRPAIALCAVALSVASCGGNEPEVPEEAKAFCEIAEQIATGSALNRPTVPTLAEFSALSDLYTASAEVAPDEIAADAKLFAGAVEATVEALPGDLDQLEPNQALLVFEATADEYLRTPEANAANAAVSEFVSKTCELDASAN